MSGPVSLAQSFEGTHMKPAQPTRRIAAICGFALLSLFGCGDDTRDAADGGASGSGSATNGGTGGKVSGGAGGTTSGGSGGTFDASACKSESSDLDKAVCAANAFLDTLDDEDLSTIKLDFSDAASRTKWSNLPGVTRAGIKMSELGTESQQSALAMMRTVLSESGISDLTGVRAADDYLGAQGSSGGMMGGGGPGGGGGYSSTNYSVAVFGTPSATSDWAISFGGHHMAYNITFVSGTGYPVPNHLGVEPKSSFTVDGSSYEPLSDEGSAFVALFAALSSSELDAAYLEGETYADVLIGPVEYGTGSDDAVKAKYPSGSNRKGVKVSSLSSAQRELAKAAIVAWVGDYNASIADGLVAEYTSTDAYEDTFISWAGTKDAGPDVDVDKTYMRIDGPRLWLEVACQAGVVIQGQTHYHTIFRDKSFDYGDKL